MNVAMISWDYTSQAYPIRLLSAILSEEGHGFKILFPLTFREKAADLNDPGIIEKKSKGLLKIIEECDLLGFSFLANHAGMAARLAKIIKKRYPKKTIISGGIHASVMPDQALEFSDYVCVGEGEKSFPAFIKALEEGRDPLDIPGIIDGSVPKERRTCSGTVENLDTLPVPGFFFDRTYIYMPDDGRWEKADSARLFPLKKSGEPIFSYYLFPDRGCAGNCSYCCRPLMKKLSGQTRVRKRSATDITAELVKAREEAPHIRKVFIYSDDFMFWSKDELMGFIEVYKKKIGLPFSFLCSPRTYDDGKMEILFGSGLVSSYGVGIQTGSDRMKDIYRRRISNDRVIETAKRMRRFSKKYKVRPVFDFIIDSPWETDEDRLKTLELIARLPKPFKHLLYTFTFYPGTELYEKALREGMLKESESLSYFSSLCSDVYYLNTRLRRKGRGTDIFIKLSEIAGALPAPFSLIRFLYHHKPGVLIEPLYVLARVRKSVIGR